MLDAMSREAVRKDRLKWQQDGSPCRKAEGSNTETRARVRKDRSKIGGQNQMQKTRRLVDSKGTMSIRALYLNARSIRNKVDELVVQISTKGYDLVAITETWLQGGNDWELNIQGFQVIRNDRQEGKGGGVNGGQGQ